MRRLIDADALKEYIDMQKGRPFIGCTIGEALKMMIDEQPTIEERKTGRWISDVAYYDEEGCPCIVSRCNQCGEVNQETNYCPNCGSYNGGGA